MRSESISRELIMIVSFFITAVMLLGCAGMSPSRSDKQDRETGPSDEELEHVMYCEEDSDCVCGGVDPYTGKCFMGNVRYYDRYVDKERSCPDFCTGVDGSLVMRCIDDECIQMYGCFSDADCGGGRCVDNKCVG